jgi:hypothetical protein
MTKRITFVVFFNVFFSSPFRRANPTVAHITMRPALHKEAEKHEPKALL